MSGKNKYHLNVDAPLVLEAWEWLSGTHAACSSATPIERVSKAETCLSSAINYAVKHPDGAKRWASSELKIDGLTETTNG